MRDFIAFQQFSPEERICGIKCIWCSGIEKRNKAHIISRKLTLTSHKKTILRYSVCNMCNSKCSELEGWILRNTPLGWLRFFYYLSSNKNSETNSIPSYFYAPDVKEWLLFKLEGKRENRKIESQLILKINNEFQLFTESSPLEIMDRILTSLRNQSYRKDVKDTFPEDFSPRVLVDGEMVILIARCKEELDGFVKIFKSSTLQQKNAIQMQPKNSELLRQHFKWSKENWLKFCAKSAYEALCLFEGAERCLKPEFQQVRSYVLTGISQRYREIVFDEHGPVGNKDVPQSLQVDLTVGQNSPDFIPAILPHIAPGMHSIILYEVDGWICSSISICGFPASVIVLGGPNTHLDDLYVLIYDPELDEFDFTCLAYDSSKPIIPMYVHGEVSEIIASTYHLKNIGL